MRILRLLALATTVALVAFGTVTLAALESGPMAVVRTTADDGSERRTRVWFAREDGALWIESATPERPFYLDLAARREFRIDTREGPFAPFVTTWVRADLVPEPGGHDHIRGLLAGRYGWADRWIALLQDTGRSRAVRATPLAE